MKRRFSLWWVGLWYCSQAIAAHATDTSASRWNQLQLSSCSGTAASLAQHCTSFDFSGSLLHDTKSLGVLGAFSLKHVATFGDMTFSPMVTWKPQLWLSAYGSHLLKPSFTLEWQPKHEPWSLTFNAASTAVGQLGKPLTWEHAAGVAFTHELPSQATFQVEGTQHWRDSKQEAVFWLRLKFTR